MINGEYLNNLRFANDIVLVSEPTDKLQQIILKLRESSRVKLKLNKKTKVMFNNHIPNHEIKEEDEVKECVQE